MTGNRRAGPAVSRMEGRRTKRMQTAADIPARLKAEIKAFLRASRWAGETYRAIQANVAQRYNTSVDLHTIHDWWYEDAEDVRAFNNHRLKMMVDQDLEIAVRTGELVRDRIEEETDTFKLVGAYKISRDAVNNWVRAGQDQKHSNELMDLMRQLLAKPQEEQRRIAAQAIREMEADE